MGQTQKNSVSGATNLALMMRTSINSSFLRLVTSASLVNKQIKHVKETSKLARKHASRKYIISYVTRPLFHLLIVV